MNLQEIENHFNSINLQEKIPQKEYSEINQVISKLRKIFTEKYPSTINPEFYPATWINSLDTNDIGRVRIYMKLLSKFVKTLEELETINGYKKFINQMVNCTNNSGYFWQAYATLFIKQTIGCTFMEYIEPTSKIDSDIMYSVNDKINLCFHVKDCLQAPLGKSIFTRYVEFLGNYIDDLQVFNSDRKKLTLISMDINSVMPKYIDEEVLKLSCKSIKSIPGETYLKVNENGESITIRTGYREAGDRGGFFTGYNSNKTLKTRINEENSRLHGKNKNTFHFLMPIVHELCENSDSLLNSNKNLDGIVPISICFDVDGSVIFNVLEMKVQLNVPKNVKKMINSIPLSYRI